MNAAAYVNAGKWIADCPRRDCANAERLEPHQGAFACSNCLQIAAVDWPSDVDELTEVLDARPVPSTRNWAPAGHRQANACGFPEGQSVAQLRDENREHEVA